MTYVFEPGARPVVAVRESEAVFPVRRIFCVGQNYSEHVREMGGDASRPDPFFFTKPADAVVANGATIPYAVNTANLHHEIELVTAIGKGGADIAESAALGHVFGYGVGVDLTRRDRQNEAKEKGRPWDLSKGFDQSAPLAALTPAAKSGHLAHGRIWLSVNGAMRQDSDLDKMIWSVPEIVSILSRSFMLASGDLIFTGTPAGVGAIKPGDQVAGGIDGLAELSFNIAPD